MKKSAVNFQRVLKPLKNWPHFCIFDASSAKYLLPIAIPPATPFLCPLVLLRKLDSSTRLFNYSKNQYVYDTLI